MSTAQVANSGIVGAAARISQPRSAIASSLQSVEALSGTYAAPARDQTLGFDDDQEDFAPQRRRRRHVGQFQDRVVSFGGVLVSREIGTAIMQAQAASSARSAPLEAAEAERGVAIYEFNQALMGTAEIATDVGISR
jgi:hypothetical protein